MNRQEILEFHPQLLILLHRLKIVNLFFITVVIILYVIAVYCLLKEQMFLAVFLASIAAMTFHFSQKYMLKGVWFYLGKDKNNQRMLEFLDKEMARKLGATRKSSEIKAFFHLLEKAIKVVES